MRAEPSKLLPERASPRSRARAYVRPRPSAVRAAADADERGQLDQTQVGMRRHHLRQRPHTRLFANRDHRPPDQQGAHSAVTVRSKLSEEWTGAPQPPATSPVRVQWVR